MEERVASVADVSDGEMRIVMVDGKKTLLARVDGRYYAMAARCPHWGGPLEEGLLHGPRLMCPWHKAVFDVRDGLLEPPALDTVRQFRVRVAGDDVFVDRAASPEVATGVAPDERRQEEGPTDQRTFVVIGGGAAGAMAVEQLRASGYTGRIVLVSAEDRWPYDRPNLSKDFLTGKLESKWLPLREPAFYDSLGIERRHAMVTELDVAGKTLRLSRGDEIKADAVLVATGSRARRLPVEGGALSGVFTLRSWGDAEALVSAAESARKAVVVGASFIGMETAASLVERGIDVTVVAPESVAFELILGSAVGAVIQRHHERRGTRFALGRGVARILGDAAVHGVELEDGTALEADLVVVGIGVQPATDFVMGVERDHDGGLPVDASLLVAPGVWAAGDVARYRESQTGRQVRVEHWRLAEQQGRAAARAMLGAREPFAAVPFFWTQHFDLRVGYAGVGLGWDDHFVCGDLGSSAFTAIYTMGGEVVAACGTQDDELSAFLELATLGDLPTVAELRGRQRAGFPDRLLGRRVAG